MWNNKNKKKKKKKKKRRGNPDFCEISSLTRPWLRTPTTHHLTRLTRCVTAYRISSYLSIFFPFIFNASTDQTLNLSDSIYLHVST